MIRRPCCGPTRQWLFAIVSVGSGITPGDWQTYGFVTVVGRSLPKHLPIAVSRRTWIARVADFLVACLRIYELSFACSSSISCSTL